MQVERPPTRPSTGAAPQPPLPPPGRAPAPPSAARLRPGASPSADLYGPGGDGGPGAEPPALTGGRAGTILSLLRRGGASLELNRERRANGWQPGRGRPGSRRAPPRRGG